MRWAYDHPVCAGSRLVVVCLVCVAGGCGRFGFDVTDAARGRAGGDGQVRASDTGIDQGDAGSGAANPSDMVLFVRGGSGTVGLNNTGGDANACDTTDHGGEGWAALATALGTVGFTVVEHLEGPVAARAPADLSNLDQYGIVVFGSNNFAYTSTDADAVDAYVRAGGAVLFISDAGFCLTNFDEAPNSDQVFATRFDLVIDQDSGVGTPLTVTKTQFAQPNHPILAGVSSFQAIGTSPITVVDNIADVTPQILVPATGQVRNNDAPMGTLRNATAADAALVVAQAGAGRVAAFFDRDVWTTGPLTKADDATLAKNVFRWLHGDI
jgi:hypothetical protein